MHAYLFVGGESETREKLMVISAEKAGGKAYEFPLQKIADVRDLANFTKFSQSGTVSIIIRDLDKATNEALSAFLKNLEEPGKNISYFMSCTNEEALLPTIVSRCQVKRVTGNFEKADADIFAAFTKMSLGEKLKFFDGLKKKDEAKDYLRKLILSAHAKMISQNAGSEPALLIKIAQKVVHNLDKNANPNLQMTNFAIKSDKSVFT